MEVLLISGFLTHPDEISCDIYSIFQVFFMNSDIKLTIFRYKSDESILTIYENLEKEIPRYSKVLAYSLGGTFLMHYLIKNNIDLSAPELKYIFLMPLLEKIHIVDLVRTFPYANYIKIFKPLFIPNYKLASNGNMLNDVYMFVHTKQLNDAHLHMLIYSDIEIITVLNSNSVYLCYAIDEKITNIKNSILNRLTNISYIKGKHAAFIEIENCYDFFKILNKLIKNEKNI